MFKNILSEIQEESKTISGRYFLSNFFNDFMRNKKIRIEHEEKTLAQKKFEKYLLDNRILITDYDRLIRDPRYFQVITNVILSTNKTNCVFSFYDLSYKSDSCVFYSYDIPRNATEKQFRNIYNYLFIHQDSDRICAECKSLDPFYYCIDCGIYSCREFIRKNLKFVLVGKTDVGYIDCKCGHTNILYRLPANFTF